MRGVSTSSLEGFRLYTHIGRRRIFRSHQGLYLRTFRLMNGFRSIEDEGSCLGSMTRPNACSTRGIDGDEIGYRG